MGFEGRLDLDEPAQNQRTQYRRDDDKRFSFRVTLGEMIVLGGLFFNIVTFYVQATATRTELAEIKSTIDNKLQTRERAESDMRLLQQQQDALKERVQKLEQASTSDPKR